VSDLSAWVPTIITAAAAIFTAGTLTGRIHNQETTLKEHHERLNLQEGEIKGLGNRMTASEAWREGYNAASLRNS
jgi:hypothetical protein